MKTKTFCLGDVLSVTTEHLVTPRHMDGIYDILNWMTGDSLFTHQLPRAGRACKPALLAQFPQLAQVDASSVTPETWRTWLDEQIAKHGDVFDVVPLSGDSYGSRDPLEELESMVGPERVIVLDGSEGVSDTKA